MDVTVDPAEFGEPTVITVDVPEDVDGNVTIVVDGEEYSVKPVDGVATLELDNLTAGTHVVDVSYPGDDKYQAKDNHTSFVVPKAGETPINATADGIKVGEDAVIVISVPEDATGTVVVDVNGTQAFAEIVDGVATVSVPGLGEGSYNATVKYLGDDNHDAETTSVVFDVAKVDDYDMNVTPSVDEQDVVLDIELPEDATGTITVSVDGEEFTVPVNDTITLSDLAPGDHNITVTYNGDDKYDPETEEFEVSVPAVDDYDMGIAQNGTDLVITLPEDANGEVTVDINGTTVTAPVVDGKAVIDISDLEPGDYPVTATYSDDKYAPKSENATVSVPKVDDYEMDVTANETDVVVELPEDATGNVTVLVDGEEYPAEIVNGTAIVDISDLEPGDHVIDVIYPGDDKYAPAKNSTVVSIPKIDDYEFSADASDIVGGEDAIITINAPEDATGLVIVEVDGTPYLVNLSESNKLTVKGLAPGNYSVNARYLGDDRYAAKDNSTEFDVAKYETEMDITLDDVKVGENSTITVDLPADATGNVTVSVGGVDYTAPVKKGVAVVDIPAFDKEGKYPAVITYSGDDKYDPVTGDAIIDVEKTGDYPISVNNNDDELVVSLPEDATGNVTVSINGTDYVVPVKDGKAVLNISDLDNGEYDVKVTYDGDDKYDSKDVSSKITIDRVPDVILIASDLEKYFSGPESYPVSLIDTDGNPVAGKLITLTINGITYTRHTDAKGNAFLPIRLYAGEFNIHIEVPEYSISKNHTVVVKHTIEADDLVKVYHNGTQFYAKFLDGEGNALANTQVTFNIHGVSYNPTTDANGVAKLEINIETGKYIITSFNPVTGENRSNNITVISKIVENSNVVKYYKNATQFSALILNPDGSPAGAGEKVTMNIHGRIYTRYTDSTGHVSLDIDLEPGDYIMTTYYEDCREGNTIKVLPTLITDDLNMKYGDKSVFTAKVLDGQGNPYANQNVTFDVHGVSYNRSTDAQGIAKLNINLMPGEYDISSSYNGYGLNNKITIA